MRKFSNILLENRMVELGEPEPVDDMNGVDNYLVIPIIVDGIEYSTDEVSFYVEPRTAMDHGVKKTIYRPDIKIKEELQHQGIGYKIYKEFLFKYGNMISVNALRENDNEIPRIYNKLSMEDGVNYIEDEKCIFVCTDDWIDEYGDELDLDLFNEDIMRVG